MKKRWVKWFCFFLPIIAFSFLMPKLFSEQLNWGQLTKQAYQLSMAENIALGNFHHWFFPNINILESPRYSFPTLWIEEFPLYVFSVVALKKIFFLNSIYFSGKLLSFLFSLLFLWGLKRLIKQFCDDQFLFVSCCAFPLFLIYSVSFMPEMMMMGFIVWGYYFFFQKKKFLSWLSLTLATLAKYYAFSSSLGLVFFLFFNYREMKKTEKIKWSFLLLTTVLPALFFIAYFMQQSIPNPISLYRELKHDGHLSSFNLIFSLHFYQRIFTWNGIKNFTPMILIVLLFSFMWHRRKSLKLHTFLISNFLGYLVLVFVFANGVYIHDYYSIQLLIPVSLIFAWFFQEIPKKMAIFLSFLLVILGIHQTYKSTRPLEYIAGIADKIKQRTLSEDIIAISSDRTIAPLAIESKRRIYSVNEKYFFDFFPAHSAKGNYSWVVLVFNNFENMQRLKITLNNNYEEIEEGKISSMNYCILKKKKI